MTSEDHHPGDDGPRPAPARLGKTVRGRSRTVAGAAGLAAVLGVGAYLTTSAIVDDDTRVAQDFRPVAPITTSTTPEGTSSPAAGDPTVPATARTTPERRATTTAAAQAAQPERDPEEVRKEVMAARRAAAKNGFDVQRPLDPGTGGAAASETTRSLPDGGTMRITTAKGDLTGQRPLLWAADEGRPVGENRCTQKFRFSQGESGGERPTMLLCWRTSATRSVAVLAVARTGTPPAAASAAVIDSEWKKLG